MARISRAREAEPSAALRQAERPAPGAGAAPRLPSDVAAIADSILAICGSRRTMELGRSRRMPMMMVWSPRRRRRWCWLAAPGELGRYGVDFDTTPIETALTLCYVPVCRYSTW
ncbi:MAG: hypothetical protein ACLPSW_01780 [Roseiarcus sp.]